MDSPPLVTILWKDAMNLKQVTYRRNPFEVQPLPFSACLDYNPLFIVFTKEVERSGGERREERRGEERPRQCFNRFFSSRS